MPHHSGRKGPAIQALASPAKPSVGLGLRRALLDELRAAPAGDFDFLEVAPENWINIGGAHGAALHGLAERYPLSCHGLSLSLGGPAPLDLAFLRQVRDFLDRFNVPMYSEHLSYCGDDGHLYDLLPLPFTEEAVHHVAARIRQAQDVLGRRLAVENVSYYAAPPQDMTELEFTRAVLHEADCDLLLDVNNVYVNSANHGFDPQAFLAGLEPGRVVGMHVAGHYDESDTLKIDSHGAPVKPLVWALLAQAYARFGVQPTLLERDFNFPPYPELVAELQIIRHMQHQAEPGQVVAHG
ncbi:HvfB family MNIO-type RiPP peptide maturase [Pseudomonas halotolerans]|uniref:HvfB family MNIO-type RiPP peptide maturase n=1 Tax=Pseudomonas halotolerans TaxID=3143552 RepID=UPI0031D0E11A